MRMSIRVRALAHGVSPACGSRSRNDISSKFSSRISSMCNAYEY